MDMGVIYAVRSHLTGTICYVGQTRKNPLQRWREHAKGKTPVSQAIRFLGGPEEFDFLILEQVPEEKLNCAEQFWIKRHGTTVPSGLNCTEGGHAGRRSDATRKRMSEARRRLWADPEFRARTAEGRKGGWTEERRAAASEKAKAQIASGAFKADNTGLVRSAETCAKLGEISKERWADPEFKKAQIAKMVGRKASAETRARLSAASRARDLTEELRTAYRDAANRRWAKHREEKANA